MRKSVFLSHVREAARQNGGSLEAYLEKTRMLGYEGLECDYTDLAGGPAGFAGMLSAAGLEIASVPVFFAFHNGVDRDAVRRTVADVAAAGCGKILAIPGDLQQEQPEALPRMVEGLHLLTEAAGEAGVTVTLEDFDNVISPCATPEGLAYLFGQVPELKFNLDTGNFLYLDRDVLECSAPFADRIAHIHLKDRSLVRLREGEGALITVGGNELYPCPVGSGVIPMKAALDLARRGGYDGFCSAEHFGAVDQWDYICRSAAWLDQNL